MKKKHGPLLFLTLSSADSMWPEGFVEVSNGTLTIEQARKLSVKDRAELMAQNPVRMTLAWKKRIRAFLDFVIRGESKPLGDITHSVHKVEWQGRLSEHAHFIFWTKEHIPPLHLKCDGDLDGDQTHITFKAEALASAMIHVYDHSNTATDLGGSVGTNAEDVSHLISSTTPRDEVFVSVTKQPCSFRTYFSSTEARKSINDLIRAVNLHFCSAYCTKNGTQTCKSNFPFQPSPVTKVKKS